MEANKKLNRLHIRLTNVHLSGKKGNEWKLCACLKYINACDVLCSICIKFTDFERLCRPVCTHTRARAHTQSPRFESKSGGNDCRNLTVVEQPRHTCAAVGIALAPLSDKTLSSRHYHRFFCSDVFPDPVAWCVYHATRHNTPIHNILSTVPQLSVSQKALGMLPDDGNVMPKHVGATIYN
jgi:hypothetical protein